jgi:ATP-dependent Clp protease, protease subunit
MATNPPSPTPDVQAPELSTPPKLAYAIYYGSIEQANGEKVVNQITAGLAAKLEHVHVLFQTAGGYVGDGVFLYNFFRAIPIEITLYNAGQISSAGVVAYLGAKHRITSKSATFMVHRSTKSPQFATSAQLSHAGRTLILDDQRTEAILREHITFPPKLWASLKSHDIYITGEEAVKYGLATAIGEFGPPLGTPVYNLLAKT